MATHVVARARHQVVGRFGLVVTPGGFGTPAFGDEHTVVRVAGGRLVVERGQDRTTHAIDGSTLRALAEAAGADLDAPFDVGHDTPALGDVDEPITLDLADAAAIAAWFGFGWQVLDAAVALLGGESTRPQLWPEHFDVACVVAAGADTCNLGASPGDGFSEVPYLYVGPWSSDRPGDPSFWNAPFGAVRPLPQLESMAAGVQFLVGGMSRFRDT